MREGFDHSGNLPHAMVFPMNTLLLSYVERQRVLKWFYGRENFGLPKEGGRMVPGSSIIAPVIITARDAKIMWELNWKAGVALPPCWPDSWTFRSRKAGWLKSLRHCINLRYSTQNFIIKLHRAVMVWS